MNVCIASLSMCNGSLAHLHIVCSTLWVAPADKLSDREYSWRLLVNTARKWPEALQSNNEDVNNIAAWLIDGDDILQNC